MAIETITFGEGTNCYEVTSPDRDLMPVSGLVAVRIINEFSTYHFGTATQWEAA